MKAKFVAEFTQALECLCKYFDETYPEEELIGLGLICGDDVTSMGPYLLPRSAVPKDAEPDYRFNPVDWEFYEGAHCFDKLNAMLKNAQVSQGDTSFPKHVRTIFDSCAEAITNIGLHARYGEDLFVTVGGADPTNLLEGEERRFVERVNSPNVFSDWLRDFA